MLTRNKKRKFDAVMGMPVAEIQLLKDVYKRFLIKQKSAAAGLFTLTGLDRRQDARRQYIDNIMECFNNLIRSQSVKNWETLLILFVQYRIALYTENFKFQSTFGDALRVVQTNLLYRLQMAYTNNSDCSILKSLHLKIINAPKIMEPALSDSQQLEEIKVSAAAFGYNEALISYSAALVTESENIRKLSAELIILFEPSVMESSQSPEKAKPLQYGSLYKATEAIDGEQNPATKRQRTKSMSTST